MQCEHGENEDPSKKFPGETLRGISGNFSKKFDPEIGKFPGFLAVRDRIFPRKFLEFPRVSAESAKLGCRFRHKTRFLWLSRPSFFLGRP